VLKKESLLLIRLEVGYLQQAFVGMNKALNFVHRSNVKGAVL
jgi:hypothetical protein